MRAANVPAYVRDTLLRMFPHRERTGLLRIGKPGRDSPVLLTGNFTLTVRRLRDRLRGHNVWLLVANSKGINVWCAAGGGHLTHHDVISVVRTSGIETLVDHRVLILPQLAATGVERRRVTEATGFETRWGPARLEDLPGFLRRGGRVHKSERFMRFPPWERMEMAAMWGVPMLAVTVPVLWGVSGLGPALIAGGSLAVMVLGLFGLLPWLQVRTRARFVTFAAFAAGAGLLGTGVLSAFGLWTVAHVWAVVITCIAGMAVLSIDLAGTTPWYASYINSLHNEPHIDLVTERCNGSAECVLVCPRDVLMMDGPNHKVQIARPEQCIACGACIVQCPRDALRFRYEDGRVVNASSIRTTRLNLLGRRAVRVTGPDGS